MCIDPNTLKPSESMIQGRDNWIKDIKMFRDDCQQKSKWNALQNRD